MRTCVIIGAGASGLIAAAESAKRGNKTVLVEKMPKCARKLMITGKGRCNVTNNCNDIEKLVACTPKNGRFLYSAFSAFMPRDTIKLLETLGVKTKVERGGRVFPVSDRASDVVDALVKNARGSGVKFVHTAAQAFEFKDGLISAILLADGRKIPCDSAAVCTGGVSYPLTGSTGDGYKLAESAGHSVTEITPSLVSLRCSDSFISALQGLSLKNVLIKLQKNGKTIYKDFGEMLFTHYGISGPVVLSASSHIRSFGSAEYKFIIDFKSALDEQALDKRLLRDFAANSNKTFENVLALLLPKKLIGTVVLLSGIEPRRRVNEITKEERRSLIYLLKNFTVNISGFYDIKTAVITSGGVNVKEINPKTMRSKLVENLYFAGEVIDVDAYTGGFNLQIAFSTGYLCGKNI
ncbi:MAG: NAD(P)/FAD-dependent oxidoreductase [Clostridiales bacterium]|nr:NAD(P)/FAD-dependent oxidoreductase [Clostridiales bacterium]